MHAVHCRACGKGRGGGVKGYWGEQRADRAGADSGSITPPPTSGAPTLLRAQADDAVIPSAGDRTHDPPSGTARGPSRLHGPAGGWDCRGLDPPHSALAPPGRAGFHLVRGGGGQVDTAPWLGPPPSPKKGSIDEALLNPTETDPRAPEVTRT